MKRVYVLLGSLSLALGLLGIFLPLLPTTPFLLLTAACGSRDLPASTNACSHTNAWDLTSGSSGNNAPSRCTPRSSRYRSCGSPWGTAQDGWWRISCCAFSCWHWLPASRCTSSPTAPSEGENKPHLHNAEERTKLFTSRRSASREKHERSLPAQKLGPGNPCLARVRTIIIKVYPTNN